MQKRKQAADARKLVDDSDEYFLPPETPVRLTVEQRIAARMDALKQEVLEVVRDGRK